MYYANDENGVRVKIDSATAEHHYFCPACKSRMIIKRGEIIAPHFAHKARAQCDPWYTGKMSQWHRKLQNKFPPEMQEVILWNDDNTEYHVADVLVGTKGNGLVFEFQHSDISAEIFISRTHFYMNLGYSVAWIFDYQDSSSPKCLFYEDIMASNHIKRVKWPGRDRVRVFDSEVMRGFIDDCSNSEHNLSVLFHVNTGRGQTYLCEQESGYLSYRWEYTNPLVRENYFIRPDFNATESLSDFYAEFFTEEELDAHIKKTVRKYKHINAK